MMLHSEQINGRRSIRRPMWQILQGLLLAVTVGIVGCVAALATHHDNPWPRWVPSRLQWLNDGSNWQPTALVITVIAVLCITTYELRRDRSSATAPVMIVAGLTVTTLVLGFSAYWRCTNAQHPRYVSPFLWTVSLVKGGIGDNSMGQQGLCPQPVPTAIEVARLTIVAALFISLAGVAAAAFRTQSDRLRARWARSATVVVDLDDDSVAMIGSIAQALRSRSTLVVMTDNPDKGCVVESRRQGARVVQVDFDHPKTIVTQRFWRRLYRVYLLSADPSTNLLRLNILSQRLAPIVTKRRIPLVVRIDDPWLAEAWRAQQFGQRASGSDHLWAGDTTSKYEATARRLIDQILEKKTVRRLFVCGASQLTAAICVEMALRNTEHGFHRVEGEPGLPALTLVARDADEYTRDHRARHVRKGFGTNPLHIDTEAKNPTAPVVSELVKASGGGDATTAVIVVDSAAEADPILGTRLAERHPTMPIYVWDAAARLNAERIPVACELRTYRLGMELPEGQAHDNFERTAMLIHERYASSETDRTKAASKPWALLSDFYKNSNHRQMHNALWIVEKIAGHSWKTGDTPREQLSPEAVDAVGAVGSGEITPSVDPIEVALSRLKQLGFSKDDAYALAQAEWEEWRRYLTEREWTLGPERDTDNKQHERLVGSWDAVLADRKLEALALRCAADTQIALATLKKLGLTQADAYAMAQTEWEAWSRSLINSGWKLGPKTNTKKRQHERLLESWEATLADPELKALALMSLADKQVALAKLKKLGFDEDTAYAMAQEEWEDWSRYLRSHCWTHGDRRNEGKKKHEKLVDDWQATVVDPVLKAAALRSLAGTMVELMKLGYRSCPMWETYRRTGTVTAKYHWGHWNWINRSGEAVRAPGRTWEVSEGGHSWPVRNDIFRASYRRKHWTTWTPCGKTWTRYGVVLVRQAHTGETIHTLEGPVMASDGDWVIQGNRGEQWPIARDEFERRYTGPVPVYDPSKKTDAKAGRYTRLIRCIAGRFRR
jgi:hypothetical protein